MESQLKTGRTMSDSRMTEAFLNQSAACAGLESPFMAQLMGQLAQLWLQAGPLLLRRLQNWQGDLGPSQHSVPLRLAGGLHFLVQAGKAAQLAVAFPPYHWDEAALTLAIADVFQRFDVFLDDWMTSPPQTNEVGRSAPLLAVAAHVSAEFGLPLRLSELGASAGLNLWFDRYTLDLGNAQIGHPSAALVLAPKWQGSMPPQAKITVAARAGCDLQPLDPRVQGARLAAYIWPDQPERAARLQQAIHLSGACAVQRSDAADWLQARLLAPWEGYCHLVYHTVAFQYFPQSVQSRIRAAMAAAGARATNSAPLAWFSMEADGQSEGAALTLHLWPNHRQFALGRAGFHGQWINWHGTVGK
jgi:hypothetical protein